MLMKKNINALISFGNIQLKNGYIRSATNESLATKQHTPSEKLVLYYEELAKHNVGMIITGFCFPSLNEIVSEHMLGLYEDEQIPAFRHLCDTVHKYETPLLLQIVAGGNYKTRTPQDYSINELYALPEIFMNCAKRAQSSDFDGIQLHIAHGYMLSQFLNPNRNKRNDIYGGSLENRSRLLIEILTEIRKNVPSDFHISAKLHCSDYEEGGMTLSESLEVAQMLQDKGLDSLEISGGNYRSLKESNFYHKEANIFAQSLSIPVFVVGGNRDKLYLSKQFEESQLSGFSMCRTFISQPNFLDEKISKDSCIRCAQCYQPGTRCILQRNNQYILASDFDGTLSQDHLSISPADIEAIRLFSKNHIFGIISGRTFLSLEYISNQYHIPYDFLTCFNGALVVDNRGKVLYEQNITQDISSLLEILGNSEADTFHAIGKSQILLGYGADVPSSTLTFEKDLYADFEKVTQLDEIDEIFILTCEFKDDETALRYAQQINKEYPYLHAVTNTRYIDIMEKGVSKQHAVEFLHSYYKIPQERTFTVGDSYNDLEMIRQFNGFAIAGNLDLEDVSTQSVTSVREAIELLLSNKEIEKTT